MRLIDADALHLGKFVEPRTEWHQGWNDALDAATTQAPTIDAVPVVRCSECVLSENCTQEDVFRLVAGIENPFCCVGKRKDGEG